jgi:hypothetical protein
MHLSESQAIELHEFIDQCKLILHQRQPVPELPYWLCGDGDDEGLSLCWDCLHKRRPTAEWGNDLCGGYDCEEDSSEVCDECGKLLQYTLTDYGVDSELENFTEYPFDWEDAQHCYEVASVIDGICDDDTEKQWKLYGVLVKGCNRPAEIVPPLPHEAFA